MNLLFWVFLQLFSYSLITWVTFVAIAFCFARYAGLLGVFIGHIAIAVIIYILDVRWVTAAMRAPDWDGTPDLDMIFFFGFIIRVLLINSVLLAITYWAFRIRRRYRTIRN